MLTTLFLCQPLQLKRRRDAVALRLTNLMPVFRKQGSHKTKNKDKKGRLEIQFYSARKELHDSYFSINITRVTKSKRMRWAGHAVYMGEQKCKENCGSKI